MSEESAKPPAQVLGVQGFVATVAKPSEPHDPLEKWHRLAAYPPFQAYIEEREPNLQGINSARYALERGQAAYAQDGDAFFQAYLAWWDEKAYWRGEDPLGRR